MNVSQCIIVSLGSICQCIFSTAKCFSDRYDTKSPDVHNAMFIDKLLSEMSLRFGLMQLTLGHRLKT